MTRRSDPLGSEKDLYYVTKSRVTTNRANIFGMVLNILLVFQPHTDIDGTH